MQTTAGGDAAAAAGGPAASDGRYPKKHITLDPESLARLARLTTAHGRSASEVIRLALEHQETGNNRLARHGLREPLQAIRLTWDLAARRLAGAEAAELGGVVDRALRTIEERLGDARP